MNGTLQFRHRYIIQLDFQHTVTICYRRQGGYVFASVCLSVSRISKKQWLWTNYDDFKGRGGECVTSVR